MPQVERRTIKPTFEKGTTVFFLFEGIEYKDISDAEFYKTTVASNIKQGKEPPSPHKIQPRMLVFTPDGTYKEMPGKLMSNYIPHKDDGFDSRSNFIPLLSAFNKMDEVLSGKFQCYEIQSQGEADDFYNAHFQNCFGKSIIKFQVKDGKETTYETLSDLNAVPSAEAEACKQAYAKACELRNKALVNNNASPAATDQAPSELDLKF